MAVTLDCGRENLAVGDAPDPWLTDGECTAFYNVSGDRVIKTGRQDANPAFKRTATRAEAARVAVLTPNLPKLETRV